MSNFQPTNIQKKKRVLMSPIALALSACGSGSGSGVNKEQTTDIQSPPKVSVTYSDKLDFSNQSVGLEVPPNYADNWAGKQVYGASEYFFAIMMAPNIVNLQSSEDSDILILPSWFKYMPFMPAVSLTVDNNNAVSIGQFDETATIGWARNWEEIEVAGKAMMVIADTGHELATGYETWLNGDVWLAEFSGNGNFEITAISGINAFYHDIDVGDINGDGLDDILAINMGYDEGADPYPLHVFYQEQDGSFTQQLRFMSFTDDLPMLGGAGGALVDLNNDGALEIIQTAYTQRDFPNWDMDHAFRIFSSEVQGDFSLQFSAARSGEASKLGSANVYDSDLDLDGDTDLILYMEGGGKQGIQIWENNGNLEFSETTKDWLDLVIWSNQEFSIRDFSVADLNGDGYMDIFFNGFGPNLFQNYGELNLGSYIFLNNKGENFLHLKDETSLVFDAAAGKQFSHIRLYQTHDESFEVLLTNYDNTFGIIEVDFSAFDGMIA